MHQFIRRIAEGMATAGGLMLVGLILLTCLSILGRELNAVLFSDAVQSFAPGFAQQVIDLGLGGISGDYELIEAGIAFAIFAFLPYCQLTGGHATVDIFTARLPERVNRVLTMLWDIVFAAVLILIAVQLFAGTGSKMRSGQTTLILQFPVWWAYALSCIGALLAAVVSLYIAIVRIIEVIAARRILSSEGQA